MDLSKVATFWDIMLTGAVAGQDPHCCPNCGVVIWSGARTLPLYSNLEEAISNVFSGVSVKSPNKPSAAKGSMGAAGGGAGAGGAGAGAASSSSPSSLAVSTTTGGDST